jgi:SAM-dependent methyltransferase
MMSGTTKFDGLAERYAEFRPSYPLAVFQRIRDLVGPETLAKAPLLIDVGCGTGISTRLLREAFCGAAANSAESKISVATRLRIVGIEPSDDMRREALAATTAPEVEYITGVAESLPVADGAVAVLLSAQAAHWFDRPRFYAEAARALAAGGVLALVFNNRSWRKSQFLEEHQRLLERLSPGYHRTYRDVDFLGEINANGLFLAGEKLTVEWLLPMTLEQWIGLNLSTTYVHRAEEAHGLTIVEQEMRGLAERYRDDDGLLPIPYETDLFTFQRGK